jgi:hypothetical protein
MISENKFEERYTMPDGTTIEIYLDSNQLHREDGPAWRMQDSEGRVVEMYFRHGKLDRSQGPAVTVSHPDGPGIEGYFRDGIRVGPDTQRPQMKKSRIQPPKIN